MLGSLVAYLAVGGYVASRAFIRGYMRHLAPETYDPGSFAASLAFLAEIGPQLFPLGVALIAAFMGGRAIIGRFGAIGHGTVVYVFVPVLMVVTWYATRAAGQWMARPVDSDEEGAKRLAQMFPVGLTLGLTSGVTYALLGRISTGSTASEAFAILAGAYLLLQVFERLSEGLGNLQAHHSLYSRSERQLVTVRLLDGSTVRGWLLTGMTSGSVTLIHHPISGIPPRTTQFAATQICAIEWGESDSPPHSATSEPVADHRSN